MTRPYQLTVVLKSVATASIVWGTVGAQFLIEPVDSTTSATHSATFFPTGSSPPAEVPVAAIVVGCVLGGIGILVLILCLCRRFTVKRYDSAMMTVQTRMRQHSAPATPNTGNLIPPVFLTEDMRDPLLQDDLRDQVVDTRSATHVFS
jgi:hypothetical protein